VLGVPVLHLSAYSRGYQGGMMQTYGAIGEDALPDKARRRFLTAGALLIGFAFAWRARAFERELGSHEGSPIEVSTC
jgi:hypothetical protein